MSKHSRYYASGRPTASRARVHNPGPRIADHELLEMLPDTVADALHNVGNGPIRDEFMRLMALAAGIMGSDFTEDQINRLLLKAITDAGDAPSATEDEPSQGEAVVYYLSFGDGLVKIGTTVNLNHRIKTFYRNHDDLLAVEPGDHRLEKLRHHQFAADLVKDTNRKELFRLSGSLRSHIAMLRTHDGSAAVKRATA